MTKQYLYLSISSTFHLNLPGENRPVEYSALSINTFLKLEEFQISQKIYNHFLKQLTDLQAILYQIAEY